MTTGAVVNSSMTMDRTLYGLHRLSVKKQCRWLYEVWDSLAAKRIYTNTFGSLGKRCDQPPTDGGCRGLNVQQTQPFCMPTILIGKTNYTN